MLLLCGYGNGITIVHERLLLQHTVPPALHGRIFGIRRMLVSWAFCGSYVLAGLIASSAGPRVLLLCAGAGMLVAFACGAVAQRRRGLGTGPRAATAGAVTAG